MGLFFGITWQVYDILGLGSHLQWLRFDSSGERPASNVLKAPQVCLWVLKADVILSPKFRMLETLQDNLVSSTHRHCKKSSKNREWGREIKGQRTYRLLFFFLSLFKKKHIIYLAALGLSCGMWDLVPWPGIEPGPHALGAQSLTHWTTREVPRLNIKMHETGLPRWSSG